MAHLPHLALSLLLVFAALLVLLALYGALRVGAESDRRSRDYAADLERERRNRSTE